MKANIKKNLRNLVRVLIPLALATLAGCACSTYKSTEPFVPEDLNAKLRSGHWKQKVDNFHVILDSSDSMNFAYEGGGVPSDHSVSKFAVEKEFLSRMNQTIPNLKLNSGLRSFGFGPCLDWEFTHLVAPQAPYSPSAFQSGLESQTCAGGGSPIGNGIAAAASDLQSSQGKIAVIVLGDGKQVSGKSPFAAARELSQAYDGRLCIYSVSLSPPGSNGDKVIKGIPGAAMIPGSKGCGGSFQVGDVFSKAGVADFVTQVFLEQAGPDCSALDSDGDGINDCLDECPNTPHGAKANKVGCWVLNNVLFDTDKSIIKPVSYGELNGVAHVFKENPGLRVEVDGHTDSQGSDQHNLGLSQRRAAAVRSYLIKHGVAANRLTSQGFGESRPVADNNTAEGRALNRRVELKVLP